MTGTGGSIPLNETTHQENGNLPILGEKGGDAGALDPSFRLQNVLQGAIEKGGNGNPKQNRPVMESLRWMCWHVLAYSWINVLFVFVPAGIIVA